MKIEVLERAKNLVSCIDSAKHNIENYKGFIKANEIRISVTTVDSSQQAIYITGERKNLMVGVLIEEAEIYLNDKLALLEKL